MKSLWRIARALWVALRGHRGQVDKAGRPYWHHLLTVALMAYGLTHDPEAVVVGLLHDYREDIKEASQQNLLDIFGFQTVWRVEHLTRVDMLYEHYIDWILREGDAVVKAVKLADLLHNTEPGRMRLFRVKSIAKSFEYEKALIRLVVNRCMESRS